MDLKKLVKIVFASGMILASFVFPLSTVHAVAPTPPSRQGYSSSVYFEAVTYDFDESGGTGSGIGRYSKVQRVSVRFTDLASGLVLLTPTWDSGVSSSIKQLVTSNIRCFDCTVTYSNDKFYIRPAGTMQCTFEILYPNYATSSLSFNITPFFTFNAQSFDDSGLLGYEVPVYDRIVHSDLSALYTETHAINTVVSTLGTSLSNIEINTNTLRNDVQSMDQTLNSISGYTNQTNSFLASILSVLQSTTQDSATNQVNQNIQDKSDDLISGGNQLHTIEDGIGDAMDLSLQNQALNVDITQTIQNDSSVTSSFSWVGAQMTHIVQGFNSITPYWEFMFIMPLVLGIGLLIIGRLR